MSIIINTDCIEHMQSVPNGSIDLVLTSPPYNAGKEYEFAATIPQYTEFARVWTSCISRLLSSNGSMWLNVGYTKAGNNQTLPLTYLYYPLIDLPFIQEIVWHYEGGMSYKKRFTHRTERWMWYAKNPDLVTFNLDAVRDMSLNRTVDKRNNALGKNPTDYWFYNRVVSGRGKVAEKTIHPAQFPEKMVERIIRACTNEGDTVLDPFAGSCTVAIVCKKLHRNYICIEKRADYCAAGKERVSKTEVTQ